jgi:hypothetical protein
VFQPATLHFMSIDEQSLGHTPGSVIEMCYCNPRYQSSTVLCPSSPVSQTEQGGVGW